MQIIGGTESPDGCRTYQVGLLEGGRLICGGTLVADQWILTAAHCVTNGASISSLSIALGGQTLSNFDGEVIPVTDVIVHPQYDRNALGFDVALMRLAAPANSDYTRALIPGPAADSALASPGGSLLSSGWGVFQSNGQSSSDELLEVLMPISQTAGCTPQPATGREICSGGIGQSTCYGDSGGPLAGIFNDEIYVLGIVSYGDSGCRFFSVYARVASFQGWITNTMASNG